jgi:hypothetical protein
MTSCPKCNEYRAASRIPIADDGNLEHDHYLPTLSLLGIFSWNGLDSLAHVDEQDFDYRYRSLVIYPVTLRLFTSIKAIPTPLQTRLI